jgi:cytochrome c biogenesis protein CcmG/thiol:disulfide interchange protein DsbE
MEMTRSGRLKYFLILGGGLIAGILLAAVVLFSAPSRRTLSAPPPATGKPMPEFKLQSLEGKEVKLADFKGKPVVINFWATWCPPCRNEMPLLDRTSKSLGGKAVFLVINDAESPELVKEFAKENKLSLPILLDPDGAINSLFFVQSYPTTYFLDEKGILRAQHIGELDEALLSKYLEAAGLKQ